MRPPRVVAQSAALMAAVALLAVGCGTTDTPSTSSRAPAPATATTATTATAEGHGPGREGPSPTHQQEKRMKIQIAVGDQNLQATLFDSAAARDLVAQLPVTIEMVDHGAVEKTGPLPAPLSLDGQPDGADPDVGDLGYYAPGNDLVLYYGDQSYYPGIVILGTLDAASRLAELAGSITATVAQHHD